MNDLDFYLVCRFYIYKSFYLLFLKPIRDSSIKSLSDEFIVRSCNGSGDKFKMERYADFLAEILKKAEGKDFLDKLEIEYTKLLVGPHKLIAPPWQSVYDGKDETLFTDCTLNVRAKYAKYGLKVTKYLSEADDHLAFELNFMLYLAGVINENAGRRYEAINDSVEFLDDNLLSWVNRFAELLGSCDGIYLKQAAFYLKEFLQNDRKFLNSILRA